MTDILVTYYEGGDWNLIRTGLTRKDIEHIFENQTAADIHTLNRVFIGGEQPYINVSVYVAAIMFEDGTILDAVLCGEAPEIPGFTKADNIKKFKTLLSMEDRK